VAHRSDAPLLGSGARRPSRSRVAWRRRRSKKSCRYMQLPHCSVDSPAIVVASPRRRFCRLVGRCVLRIEAPSELRSAAFCPRRAHWPGPWRRPQSLWLTWPWTLTPTSTSTWTFAISRGLSLEDFW